MKSIVSEKGQVTIPIHLRQKLGLKAGQVLEFQVEDGKLVARKIPEFVDLQGVIGILKSKVKNVDAYIEQSRGPGSKK